jgi:hypothetical protein
VASPTFRPLYPRERDPVLIVQEAGWPQRRCGRLRKISPSPGFDPRTVQPVASRYTDRAISAQNHVLKGIYCKPHVGFASKSSYSQRNTFVMMIQMASQRPSAIYVPHFNKRTSRGNMRNLRRFNIQIFHAKSLSFLRSQKFQRNTCTSI